MEETETETSSSAQEYILMLSQNAPKHLGMFRLRLCLRLCLRLWFRSQVKARITSNSETEKDTTSICSTNGSPEGCGADADADAGRTGRDENMTKWSFVPAHLQKNS
jgi:hypothetical protein